MAQKVFLVDVDAIKPDPNQPRKTFAEEDIAATAFTMEKQGVINPIEVDENNKIVTGEIRWKAAIKAGLKQIPCILWTDGSKKRFERQVVENLHHHELSDKEREDAIVKLWETEEYPTQAQLGKAVGLNPSRITQILAAYRFRMENPEIQQLNLSTRTIDDTKILDSSQRIKILKAVSEEKIKASDIREVAKIAKSSESLLDKTIGGSIDLKRAIETADTLEDIEEKVDLTDDQKNRLVLKVEEDEKILDKYKEDVLERVKQIMTIPKREAPTIVEPIGRTSPVRKIIAVKDEVLDNFRRYLGNCNYDERQWALRILTEIKKEIDELVELLTE